MAVARISARNAKEAGGDTGIVSAASERVQRLPRQGHSRESFVRSLPARSHRRGSRNPDPVFPTGDGVNRTTNPAIAPTPRFRYGAWQVIAENAQRRWPSPVASRKTLIPAARWTALKQSRSCHVRGRIRARRVPNESVISWLQTISFRPSGISAS